MRIEAFINSVLSALKIDKLGFKFSFESPSTIARGNGKIEHVGKFATGGFPEDGLFYANHSELVGKFSNGKTAVANNEQIIKGIQRGVAQGIQDAGFNNQSSTTEMRGDIRIDGKKAGTYLAKSVGKELNRAGWKLRTT